MFPDELFCTMALSGENQYKTAIFTADNTVKAIAILASGSTTQTAKPEATEPENSGDGE